MSIFVPKKCQFFAGKEFEAQVKFIESPMSPNEPKRAVLSHDLYTNPQEYQRKARPNSQEYTKASKDQKSIKFVNFKGHWQVDGYIICLN